jgi:hypothetical protein
MSKTVKKHGVRIAKVSAAHKSFSKASCIPADDITPAVLEDWQRQHAEATGGFSIFADMIPIDLTYSGCWLGAKLRAVVNDNDGKRVFDEDAIRSIGLTHGRMCAGNWKDGWKIAAKLYAAALEEQAESDSD